jgi:hypothetical protein
MAGRPKYQPTEEHRRQVMIMAGLGIVQAEIANLIGCSDRTLRTYYRRELDTGATEANMRVAQSLYNLATKEGNVAACIWWTKARMGWREAQDLNVGGQADNPLGFEIIWGPARPPEAIEQSTQPATIDAKAEDAETPVLVWGDGSKVG